MLEWDEPETPSITASHPITNFTNFPEYEEYPNEWDLDKVMGYPVNKFLINTHLNDAFRNRFIDSFFNPTFAFATVLYSKSDPLRLLISLYTLLHFDIKRLHGDDITEQRRIVDMLRKEDFKQKEITLDDCHRVAKQIRDFYETEILNIKGEHGYNTFSKYIKHITFKNDVEFTNEVKLFAFMEDMADIGDDLVNIRNLYTVIGWFIEESHKIFPNSRVYHFKGIQNHRVHVNRSLLMKIIHKRFPEVKWINIVDDDTHTSIRLLVRQFYNAFANNFALDEYNKYVNKLREIRSNVNTITMKEIRKMENPYNFIINAGKGFNGVAARLYNTLCPNNLNMLFNSYCVQGEDALSLKLYERTLNMVHYETEFLAYHEYVLPSNRYETHDNETVRIMLVQHYLRILSAVDYEAAQEFRRRYNPNIPSTSNIHVARYLNEKKEYV